MSADPERVRRAAKALKAAEHRPMTPGYPADGPEIQSYTDAAECVLEASGYPADLDQCRAVLQRVHMDSFRRGEDLDRALDALAQLVATHGSLNASDSSPLGTARAVLAALRPEHRTGAEE